MNNYENKRLWTGYVVDNNDPLMVNRVRVQFDTTNNEAILKSVPEYVNNKKTISDDGKDLNPEFKWTSIDPFVFLPLLPVFIKVTPKIKESVNLIYPNVDINYTEQYYIPGVLSSPLTIYKDDYESSRRFATKDRLKSPKNLQNVPGVNRNNKTKSIQKKYTHPPTEGAFMESDDVGLQGRGTCDLIIKDGDIILRAGKTTTIPKNANTNVDVKISRSFIQLSDFNDRIIDLGTSETARLEQDVLFVKSLVEWNIVNPDNTANQFILDVYLYNLPQKSGYTTNKVYRDTPIESSDKSLVYYVQYTNQSMDNVIDLINNFINQCNTGVINLPPNEIKEISNQFPLFFRPSPLTLKYLTGDAGSQQYKNISEINSKIKFKSIKQGDGLIFYKNKTGQQSTVRKETIKNYDTQGVPTTYNILGADKLLILSHESKIPSKGKIILDSTTMRGMDQKFLVEKVLPNTDSMVRGDELMKFLNLVVKFLVAHVHPFPGVPPVPVATDGTQAIDILTRMQNASNTILNDNIRIN
jgi:hypothetical protein